MGIIFRDNFWSGYKMRRGIVFGGMAHIDVKSDTMHWPTVEKSDKIARRRSMARGKKTRVFNTSKGEKQEDELDDQQNQNCGCSMADLPSPIFIDILLRLSVKALLICRCVCKTWRNLIFDPEFANLHFARGETYPLIRASPPEYESSTLYLLEDCCGFERGPCTCDYFGFQCDAHIKVDIDTKSKIPLGDAKELTHNGGGVNVNLNAKGRVKPSRYVKLSHPHYKLFLVNSCNGLLCLSTWLDKYGIVVVCNPVTREYIVLPQSTIADKSAYYNAHCGFGFSLEANKFKVIRIFCLPDHGVDGRMVAEIHTLGSGSWKSIGPIGTAPRAPSWSRYPTYLNGAIHWHYSYRNYDHIIAFDFDNEKIQSIPTPPFGQNNFSSDTTGNVSLGVLRGWLCICDSRLGYLDIWVMKDYGVEGSWSKEFCIKRLPDDGRFSGLFEPISYLRNGAILLFRRSQNTFVYYDPKIKEVYFMKPRGIKLFFEGIAHTPRFISLKDAVGSACQIKYDP